MISIKDHVMSLFLNDNLKEIFSLKPEINKYYISVIKFLIDVTLSFL